jgi:hypothetical protein
MTRDDIIRMAREAGCIPVRHPEYDNDVQVFATPDELERFASLVADAEAKRMHAEGMVTVGHMRQQIAAQRQPLTDDRIGQIIEQCKITLVNYCSGEKQTEFARAIEAAHGITGEKT